MINNKKQTKNESLRKALLIGGSASVLMTLFSPSIIAAEVKSAIEETAVPEELEVIEVTGVRGSLESALLTKRSATSIVDAISAKDMDSLPALDLGEAMQAIPGVQLNTDDGSRNSEITLRGLPGGFAKVTAEGQGFATPSRSGGAVGSSNPFGAFEASVFDGVTVVKASTADMQEGGIAGNIDKKLQKALGKKDGKYSVSIGTRYEELSEAFDKELKLSVSKHIIKDKLAFAFKVAGSDQNFRRDTANFTQYTSLNTVENNSIQDTQFISREDLNAYKAQHGINDPLSIVKVIGKAGQVTENARGTRFSGSGNIEYKPIESLKIGANFLYTKRDLGDSNMEDVQFNIGSTDNEGRLDTQRVTPLGTPIRLSDNPNPNYNPAIHSPDLATIPVYAVTYASMTNVSWTPSNRLSSTQEEAKGIFLYANYDTDDWSIDSTVSKSDSLNEFHMSGLDLRHSTKHTGQRYTDLDTGQRLNYTPTGINGVINTGRGELEHAFASITGFDTYKYSDVDGILSQTDPITGEPIYDLGDEAWKRDANGWKYVPVTAFGSTLDTKINPFDESLFPAGYFPAAPATLTDDELAALTPEEIAARAEQADARKKALDGYTGRSLDYYVNGRVQRPERDFESGDINFERFLDVGGDAFMLNSVKFGYNHSQEILTTYDVRVGGGAMNLSQINGDVLYKDKLTSDGQTPYFNGDYPGSYGSDAGWKVLDSVNLAKLVQTDMVAYDDNGNPVDFAIADPTGFAVKLQGSTSSDEFGLNENYRFNFTADQIINAFYLMGFYEGEIAGFSYNGNVGVRYIETTNDVLGQGFDDEGKDIAVITENDYDHTLPSVNLSIDITDDIVLRTAYSQAMVRPNLMAQSPSPTNTNTANKVKLENSKAEVLPYTSTNYDMSLAWYNREGSALSIGMFRKDIEGSIVTDTICPIGNHEKYNVGELELIQDGSTFGLCQEVGDYDPGNGEDIVSNREVVIKETFNSDIPIQVTGYELAIQQNLDFLPYPWNGFGGVFNFTKIDLDEGGGQPMTGIAPHTANVIGYWENNGVSIRAAYNWQDEKLLSAGGNTSFLGSDARTQTAGGRLDVSAAYRFKGGFRINFQAINLNNRQEYEFIGGNTDAINRIRYSGRTYVMNLSYNF